MEFGYFIGLIGIILTIISIVIFVKGMLTPKNPNCPTDVIESKKTVKSAKILAIIGPSIIIIGILVIIFG